MFMAFFQASFMAGRRKRQAAGTLGLTEHRHCSVSAVDILEACRKVDLKGLGLLRRGGLHPHYLILCGLARRPRAIPEVTVALYEGSTETGRGAGATAAHPSLEKELESVP